MGIEIFPIKKQRSEVYEKALFREKKQKREAMRRLTRGTKGSVAGLAECGHLMGRMSDVPVGPASSSQSLHGTPMSALL